MSKRPSLQDMKTLSDAARLDAVALLNICLREPSECIAPAAKLLGSGEAFPSDGYREIWRGILDLGDRTDPASLRDKLGNRYARDFTQVFTDPRADGTKATARIARQCAKRILAAADATRKRDAAAKFLNRLQAGDDFRIAEAEMQAALKGRTDYAQSSICLVNGNEIEETEPSWLWKPYLPAGSLTLLTGNSTAGKTYLSCAIAAAVTLGAPFPGEVGLREPGRVLFLSAEDVVSNALKPRLCRMGADVSRVSFVQSEIKVNGEVRRTYPTMSFADHRDMERFDEMLAAFRPTLVIVDPLTGFAGGKMDIHRDNEIRSFLGPLVARAEAFEFCLLAIRHTPKSLAEINPLYAGIGGVGFTAKARSEIFALADPEDKTEQRRLMVHNMTNLASLGASRAYYIRPGEGVFADFSWGEEVKADRTAILGAPKKRGDQGALATAKDALREMLADGPASRSEVIETLSGNGFGLTRRTIDRAAKDLGVRSEMMRTDNKISGARWHRNSCDCEYCRRRPAGKLANR